MGRGERQKGTDKATKCHRWRVRHAQPPRRLHHIDLRAGCPYKTYPLPFTDSSYLARYVIVL